MTTERCPWGNRSPEETIYHDHEWGRPVHNDALFFEKLTLELMQAGLSWTIVIRKREAMREAFDGFDATKIAKYDQEKIALLMSNPAIIRNRLKLESMVNNAQRFLEMQERYGSFDAYIWKFVDNKTIDMGWREDSQIPTQTELSVTISKDLKKHGFKFVGPTTTYAFLQGVGIINDHLVSCFCYDDIHRLGQVD